MDLATFVKANFWAGLVGTVVFTPFGYAYELVSVGIGSPLLKFDSLDLAMVVFAPPLIALGFAATALIFLELGERKHAPALQVFDEGKRDWGR